MVDISIRADTGKLTSMLSGIERQVPFALALALTRTAQDVRLAHQRQMRQVFQSPTRFTLNSQFVIRAEKSDPIPTAKIRFREFAAGGTPAYKYLAPNVFGTQRRHKRFERALIARGFMRSTEYAVPGPGAPLNRNGNLTGASINRMLSQLGAQRVDTTQNATDSARSRRNRRAQRFFVPGDNSRLSRGVWMRRGSRLTPFLLFVNSAPNYTRRFNYFEIARTVVRVRFSVHFRDALQRAILTSRR